MLSCDGADDGGASFSSRKPQRATTMLAIHVAVTAVAQVDGHRKQTNQPSLLAGG